MASTTWRMTGIATHGGGDLDLSELRLWGASAALDAGATLTCSHAPVAGALENLLDNDLASSCRWRGSDARSPGFYIEWTTPEAVDAWCVRLSAQSKETSVVRYDMATQVDGRWQIARNGDLVYGAGLSAARITAPVFGVEFEWRPLVGPVADSQGLLGVAVSEDGQTIVFTSRGSTAAKVSISKDGGATWTQAVGPIAGAAGFSCAAVSANGQAIVVAGAGSSAASINISRDGGVTWTRPAGPEANSYGFFGAAMSANGQKIVVTALAQSNSKVSISGDGGATWTQAVGPVADTAGFTGTAMSPNGQVIIVVGYGSSTAKVSISRDGGSTWSAVAGPIADTLGYIGVAVSADGQTIAVAGHGSAASKVSISRDSGASWSQPVGPVAGSMGFYGLAMSADGQTIAVAGHGSAASKVSISRDGGASWSQPEWAGADTQGFSSIFASPDRRSIIVNGYGSSAAKASILQLSDPIYVAQALGFDMSTDRVLPSLQQPLAQGLQSMADLHASKLLDVEFGGDGRIYGSVARKGTPSNIPMRRRVRLHRSVDGYLARETWSEVDGSYEFRDISMRYEWDVIAWDHGMQEYSTVANNQLAEVIA